MHSMLERLHGADKPAVVVLGFEPADSLQYGRVIAEGDRIVKMVECMVAALTKGTSP